MSDLQLQLFIEHSPAAMAMFDRNMRYLAASRRWLSDHRFDEPVLGRSHYDVLPDMPERWKDVHRRALAGEVIAKAGDRFDRADGTVLWLDWEARPWKNPEGEIRGIVISMEDITARKRIEEALRESEERFRTLTEMSPDCIMVNLDGRYAYANRAAIRLLGAQDAGDIVGLSPFDIVAPEFHERVRTRTRIVIEEKRETEPKEALWRRFDGTSVEVEVATRPMIWDGKPAIQVVARDITERRQAEEALREADRRKDEFLATLAHELRNPLAPIRNAVYVLKKTDVGDPEGRERARSLLPMMERQVDHLVRLVDDLLEVARITSGKIQLRKQHLDLSSVIHQAIETSYPLLQAGEHETNVSLGDERLVVEGDPVRLTQVFANLLNNAAKYTSPQGRIEISMARDGGEAIVSVRDNGIGISDEMLPRIFDLFTQSSRAVPHTKGGMGVGLALVRNLVEMHGGSVEGRSDGPGHGSEFLVRLPLAVATAPAKALEEAAAPSIRASRRILVVDNEKDVADGLAMLLQVMGANVRVAYDGASALAAVADFKPHLAFVDIGMPGMDGYETARRIRMLPEGGGVVLIALSGWGQDDDRQRAQEAGFDRHCVKPIKFTVLEELLAPATDDA
ncbi:MAG: PAS domain S-box protein [Methylocystis sp.]